MINANRRPRTLAKTAGTPPLAPLLPVAVGAAEVVVVEALEQVILEGTVNLFDSARSMHWVESGISVRRRYEEGEGVPQRPT